MTLDVIPAVVHTLLDDSDIAFHFGTNVYSSMLPEKFSPPGILLNLNNEKIKTNMDDLRVVNMDIIVVGDDTESARDLNKVIKQWYDKCNFPETAYGKVTVALPLMDEGELDEEEEYITDVNWTFIRTGLEVWLIPVN